MKAITIHQPYAHLIVTRQDELPIGAIRKRVENRVWPTNYRGPLLIHAGKSMEWLRGGDWPGVPNTVAKLSPSDFHEFAFGAIVGVADLVACLPIMAIRAERHRQQFPWLNDHWHTEGPWCWVLDRAKRFKTPIPFKGAQGLFEVPDAVVAEEIPW